MKKAIAAAVLLALLFGAAAWNIAHIDSLTGSLTASADEALAHCRAEDYDAAEDALREAIELWYGAENYTHIMIRHAEVDSATDAFYAALEPILTHDADAAGSAIECPKAHLPRIAPMEHVVFRRVFYALSSRRCVSSSMKVLISLNWR